MDFRWHRHRVASRPQAILLQSNFCMEDNWRNTAPQWEDNDKIYRVFHHRNLLYKQFSRMMRMWLIQKLHKTENSDSWIHDEAGNRFISYSGQGGLVLSGRECESSTMGIQLIYQSALPLVTLLIYFCLPARATVENVQAIEHSLQHQNISYCKNV